MDFKVYAIQSTVSNRVYVGQSENVEKRLEEHNNGRVRSTSADKPWRLLKIEGFDTRSKARWFERQLKNSRGKREKWLSQ